MAKANLVLPDGTTVAIEGTADEVAVLLSRFSQSSPAETPKKPKRKKKRPATGDSGGTRKKKDGPTGLIKTLIEEGYFKSKRSIGDIQKKLEQHGHIYANTTISPCLTRLTRSRVLRRIKENKGWVYVS